MINSTDIAGVSVLADTLGQLAGGSRLALIFFAVASLVAWWPKTRDMTLIDRYRRWSWILLTIAVLVFTPAHAAWLFGHPIVDPALNHLMDAGASLAASGCFIAGMASRGLMRGLSELRVKRGLLVNVGVLIAMVASAWLTY